MQHLVTARAHAMTVTKAADRLGVPLPDAYLEQVAQIDAFTDAVSRIAATTEQLDAAVFDAIEAGRDYHNDKTVQRLALDRQLTATNIGERARGRALELLAAALADHADTILHGWAHGLAPHTAALRAAADAGLDLDNDAAAIAKGGNVMHMMHDAQIAAVGWTEAVRGFYALAAVSGVRYAGDTATVALTPARAAALAPAYELARKARTDVDAWLLTRCGIQLRLATLAEFMARAATFTADRQAEERANEEARRQRVVNSW